MDNDDAQELLKRLQALEAENARLKQQNSAEPPKLVITETDYKGHPMLQFQRGNSRPFNLGVRKLEAIQEGWDQVLNFLSRHQGEPKSDDNDTQI